MKYHKIQTFVMMLKKSCAPVSCKYFSTMCIMPADFCFRLDAAGYFELVSINSLKCILGDFCHVCFKMIDLIQVHYI